MRKLFKKAAAHPLISGTAVITISSFGANVFNLFFNLFMVQNLSPANYGILISLISLTALITIPASSVSPTIIRFSAIYFAKNEPGIVKEFFIKIFKLCLGIGVITSLVLIVFNQNIAHFFQIKDPLLIILIAIAVLISFVSILNISLLQAKLAFNFMSFSTFMGFILKLMIGVILVRLGFSVAGAMIAVLMSSVIPYILSFIPLRFIFQVKENKTKSIKIPDLFSYGAPAALALFGISALISTDVMLVKHFYSPEEAGVYAAGLSLIGRVIFFATAPIATVLFPLVVQRHTKGENYSKLFGLAVLLVVVPSLFITAFYFLFPNFVIQIIVRQTVYQQVASLLGIFGIFITFYSLLYMLTQFFLSIKKTLVCIPISIGALLQAILIWFFHGSFLQIIVISLVITGLLIFSLLLYYFQLIKKGRL